MITPLLLTNAGILILDSKTCWELYIEVHKNVCINFSCLLNVGCGSVSMPFIFKVTVNKATKRQRYHKIFFFFSVCRLSCRIAYLIRFILQFCFNCFLALIFSVASMSISLQNKIKATMFIYMRNVVISWIWDCSTFIEAKSILSKA